TGKELHRLKGGASALAFAPGTQVLAARGDNIIIRLYDVARGTELRQLGVRPAQPAGDGTFTLVIGGGSRGSRGTGPGLAFSPDGKALIVRGADRTVRIWDVAAAKEIGQLRGHSGRIETVAFAANGKTIASGATDTTVLVWDAADPLKELSKQAATQLSLDEL